MPTDTLEDVALADVIVDINVRTDIKLDKSFVSSIRNHGILQPPIGWRGDDGKVRITAGQRRTLAAMEIGLEQIAIVIKPQEIAEAARIVTQLTENDQRQELTDSERVFGYKQLTMFGISADQIARKTNKPRAHVDQALKVASSEVAEDAIASYPIGLEQAAALVEFEDNPADVERLLEIASTSPRSFDHEAQRIRDNRTNLAQLAELRAKYEAAGWEILADYPNTDRNLESLHHLWRADDEDRSRLTEVDIKDLDGRAVFLSIGWQGAHASHYLRDYKAHGFTTYSSVNSAPQQTKEEKRAERQMGADIRSATTVRREWLKTTLLAPGSKIDIPSAIKIISGALLGADTSASDGKVYPLAAELLGYETHESKGTWDNTARTTVLQKYREGADPLRVALAVAIARTESVVGDPTWKSARESKETVEYYVQLQEWGYNLADVEQTIVTIGTRGKTS